MAYVGCGVRHLIKHMEAQFLPGMTWANHGTAWEIDHHMPIAAFNLADRQQAETCFHFTNLRPLWKHLNHAKADTLQNDIPRALAQRAIASGVLILHS